MTKRENKDEHGAPTKKKKKQKVVAETSSASTSSLSLDTLESTYQEALAAFKKDKTNKDLRRAKSAARKAWDEAVIAAAQNDGGGEPLQCRDCSQTFVWSEQELYAEKGWDHKPIRCKPCSKAHKARRLDRTKRDSSGKNICFAFKRGECERGDQCKFSHWVAPPETNEETTADKEVTQGDE